MKFSEGERVRHSNKPDWGIGQVLDDSDDEEVRVFFVGIGEKTLKSHYANLVKVSGSEADHPILDNLRASGEGKKLAYRSLPLLIENFIKTFPDGFYGEPYKRNERDYKLEAHQLLVSSLGREDFHSLLATQEYAETVKRALAVVNKTNIIFPNEKMLLKDVVKTDNAKRLFSERLYSLLYGDSSVEQRFTGFADCLLEIDAAKWTIFTYFPFIAFPQEHMFLKPIVTQEAAAVCGFELNYRKELNWLTYSKLLEFSKYLFNALSELKPRDMIDIQSFLWCTAKIDDGGYDVS